MWWVKATNRAGRTVWRFYMYEGQELSLVGVVDFYPGQPRYKAMIPWTTDKWFDELEEAKSYIESTFMERKLTK